ncbi:unnamed protein product [Schistocephalus solidus]|uniref:Protein kinase domain-containing protein n=2 Tax=Schistocephalus solidus TaxID=70667 RepID=A0A183TPM8_SCHSO|nr:unnamed protein product [Schistocephalus solidus]
MKRCPKFDQIIRQELHVLELCKKEEAVDEQNIAKFYESFSWKGNICFVFELLCVNLYQIISRNNFQGLPCMTVKKMCACILTCLTFLHKHQIIHCDLKPENILIVHPGYPLVKVIDFGSSCHVGQSLYTYIQSRFYRAPEVILGMEYDTAIDIWSFGCITMELLTG